MLRESLSYFQALMDAPTRLGFNCRNSLKLLVKTWWRFSSFWFIHITALSWIRLIFDLPTIFLNPNSKFNSITLTNATSLRIAFALIDEPLQRSQKCFECFSNRRKSAAEEFPRPESMISDGPKGKILTESHLAMRMVSVDSGACHSKIEQWDYSAFGVLRWSKHLPGCLLQILSKKSDIFIAIAQNWACT